MGGSRPGCARALFHCGTTPASCLCVQLTGPLIDPMTFLPVLPPLILQVDKGSKGKFSGSSFYYGSSSLYVLVPAFFSVCLCPT